MRKVLLFIVAAAMSCVLAGCNANVPGVTPYVTPGTYGTAPGYGNTAPGTYNNYVGRGGYGTNSGRTYRNNVGRGAVDNNRNGGNLPRTGGPPAYVPGSQSYGLR